MKTMKTRWLFSIIIAVGTACLALYGSAPLFLPQPKPASVEADQFSAERAMQHVKAHESLEQQEWNGQWHI
jgi:hypothetical protein